MTPINSQILAQCIKRRRIMNGFTQAGMCKRYGVSLSQLSRVERGITFPSADFLVKIAEPLNFNLAELLTLAASLALSETSLKDNSLRAIINALKVNMSSNKPYRIENNGLHRGGLPWA